MRALAVEIVSNVSLEWGFPGTTKVFSKPLYIDFFYDIRYIIYLQFCTNEPLQAKRLLEFVGKDQHTHT